MLFANGAGERPRNSPEVSVAFLEGRFAEANRLALRAADQGADLGMAVYVHLQALAILPLKERDAIRNAGISGDLARAERYWKILKQRQSAGTFSLHEFPSFLRVLVDGAFVTEADRLRLSQKSGDIAKADHWYTCAADDDDVAGILGYLMPRAVEFGHAGSAILNAKANGSPVPIVNPEGNLRAKGYSIDRERLRRYLKSLSARYSALKDPRQKELAEGTLHIFRETSYMTGEGPHR